MVIYINKEINKTRKYILRISGYELPGRYYIFDMYDNLSSGALIKRVKDIIIAAKNKVADFEIQIFSSESGYYSDASCRCDIELLYIDTDKNNTIMDLLDDLENSIINDSCNRNPEI